MMPCKDPRNVNIKQLLPPIGSSAGWSDPFMGFASTWIINGIPSTAILKPKSGIEKSLALDHISRIVHTNTINHDDKAKYCAYLMDKWFEPLTI